MKPKKVSKNLKSSINNSNKETYSNYRNDEFVGDALLSFIVRDYFATNNIERNLSRSKVYILVSNKYLSQVFDNLKLTLNPIFHRNNTLFKAKANQIEYMIYQMYKEKGFKKAKEFVIKNIIISYYE